jgi:membrane dipeptidase
MEDRHLDRALQRGLEMTWWLHHEIESNPGFELVTSAGQIRRIQAEGKTGAILALEGFEAVGSDLRFLDLYYRLGLRMASLTHNRRNLYADGPQEGVKTGGLTVLGRQAVQRMNELGILVDLVHTNEACFWEALELSQAPVVVSHLHPYAFQRWRGEEPQPHYNRLLDRPALEALARTGSVVGAIFFGHSTIAAVADNIITLLELAGEDHVGLGSDLYGLDHAPRGLETIDRLPVLTEELVKRNLSDEVVLKILGGNMLRLFEQVWKE